MSLAFVVTLFYYHKFKINSSLNNYFRVIGTVIQMSFKTHNTENILIYFLRLNYYCKLPLLFFPAPFLFLRYLHTIFVNSFPSSIPLFQTNRGEVGSNGTFLLFYNTHARQSIFIIYTYIL
jgi:hypothetical protein